jgi:hypothetical protein
MSEEPIGRRAFLLALGAFAMPAGAQPEEPHGLDSARLVVELLVFRQPQAIAASPPVAGEANEPNRPAGVEVLATTGAQLAKIETGLRRRGFAVLGRGACLMPVAPSSSVGLRLEELLPVTGLSGRVAVTRGQNLFLTLEANSPSADGSVASLNERRRVKYGERHYFDGEVLGAVASVTPARGSPT